MRDYTTQVSHTSNGVSVSSTFGDCCGGWFWAADAWTTTANRYIPCIERRGCHSPNHLAFHVRTKRLRKKYALVKDIILMRSIRVVSCDVNSGCINYIIREDGISTYEESN